MTQKTYWTSIIGLVVLWFASSFAASAAGLFKADPSQPPLALLISVVTPLALFLGWYAASQSFREFVLSFDTKTLVMMQAWRIIGFVFLVLYAHRMLPGDFALPAGWGDVFIGATAVFVATKLTDPSHRTAFIVWQWLGIADLVTAVGSGALGPMVFGPSGVSMEPMASLPLSLIPTFGVPLLFLVHLVCLAQARRWPRSATTAPARVKLAL